MIGKITIGKSFNGCIKYCLNDKLQEQNKEQVFKDRAEVLMYNKCYGNQQELVQQFNEVRQLNMKLSKPVLHITLSLAPGELLGKDKLMEMCEHCAKEMGFENNQYVAVSHRDTTHQHIHIVANRIGFDKRAVSDSNSYQKIAKYCRKMEQKYSLQQVLNPKKFLSKEQQNIPRFNQRKERLRQNIQQALSKSNNYFEFERLMKEKGYEITKGRGIAFTDEKKVKVKGSELGYSLQTIELMLQKKGILQGTKTPAAQIVRQELNRETLKEHDNFRPKSKEHSSKLLEHVTRPERMQEQGNPQFLQQRKRKKKKSHHL